MMNATLTSFFPEDDDRNDPGRGQATTGGEAARERPRVKAVPCRDCGEATTGQDDHGPVCLGCWERLCQFADDLAPDEDGAAEPAADWAEYARWSAGANGRTGERATWPTPVFDHERDIKRGLAERLAELEHWIHICRPAYANATGPRGFGREFEGWLAMAGRLRRQLNYINWTLGERN